VIGHNEAMLIHFMHVDDPAEAIRDIKDGFERRILEVTR
jgi:multisubunit Na+/H+ antiporter MnhE subunit